MDGIQKTLNRLTTNTSARRFVLLEQYLARQFDSLETVQRRQLEKLNTLLAHCYRNVPYYRKIFEQFQRGGEVCLDSLGELAKLPLLGKKEIKNAGNELLSSDIRSRRVYRNTSGGSTGEPVMLIQDADYQEEQFAHAMLVKSWRSVDPFDSVIKLWGAERDTFKGKKPIGDRIKDYFRNRFTLNSYNMSEQQMRDYINILNANRPKLIITYVQSIDELAQFAARNNIRTEKQRAIHTSAGTLHDFIRERVERAFSCKIFDHYGSREVSAIASECSAHDGLHTMGDHNVVEVIDADGNPVPSGGEGEVVVTNLNNYAMPLVRYRIGDRAVSAFDKDCICGRSYPKLQSVIGRTVDVFKTRTGGSVDGRFFARMLYYIDEIERFQVVQKDFERVTFRLMCRNTLGECREQEIREKTKTVLGAACRVDFEYVKVIEATPTGKYRYIISELQ